MSHLSGDMWPKPVGSMMFPSRSRGLWWRWRWCLCLDLCSSRSCLSEPLILPMVASASVGPPSSGRYRRLPLPFTFFDACNRLFSIPKNLFYFKIQKSYPHTGNLNIKRSGDSENAFLHVGDVLGCCSVRSEWVC